MPKYDISVPLEGVDGNAFMILGVVRQALRKAGAPAEDISEFIREATSGDYAHLLVTCAEWVDIIGEEEIPWDVEDYG